MVNFRKTFFFIIDYLKGSPIRKHLNDLEQILNHPNNNNSEIDVSTLNSGIYFLNLSNQSVQKTIKFIKE